MKFNTALLSLALGLSLAACGGCAGIQTQHQQIAATCESAASSLDAMTAARVAGKVTAADLDKAITVYKTTVPFCQPPALSLDVVKKAALASAAAELARMAGEVK
jgi:hypothetical protein